MSFTVTVYNNNMKFNVEEKVVVVHRVRYDDNKVCYRLSYDVVT